MTKRSPAFAKASARKRLRSYLLLSRLSNLPTVWTNVLAAYVMAGASRQSLPFAAASASLFYTGGMFLNDAFDANHDARARADRPIPAGDVSRGEAFAIGFVLMALGEALLAFTPHALPALSWGAGLGAAIVLYDYMHKGVSFGPVIMGACRGLVYGMAAAAAVGAVMPAVAIAALVMWSYIIALTWVAKAANLGYAVPWMLAGICLVDAAMIFWLGYPYLSLYAVAGFPLTLALQRVVPGT